MNYQICKYSYLLMEIMLSQNLYIRLSIIEILVFPLFWGGYIRTEGDVRKQTSENHISWVALIHTYMNSSCFQDPIIFRQGTRCPCDNPCTWANQDISLLQCIIIVIIHKTIISASLLILVSFNLCELSWRGVRKPNIVHFLLN